MTERGRVVIRTARARDAAGLATVYTHAFGPTTPAEVRRWRRNPDVPRETLIAVVDGVVASTVDIQYRQLLVDGVRILTGGIAGVATHWDHRGRGLATRLMAEAHRRIRAQGASNATLFTGHALPAIRIYRRLGYLETRDWVQFHEFARPVDWVQKRFEYRSKWLRRTPFGRALLEGWRHRVWMVTPAWGVAITYDGRRFRVVAGRRGRPDLVVRGGTREILSSFGDRSSYDRYRRSRKIRVSGDPAVAEVWRRLLTLEWRE